MKRVLLGCLVLAATFIEVTTVGEAQPPGCGAPLCAVAVVSRSDAWAVGFSTPNYAIGKATTLIEHWDGSSWQTVPSPNPGPAGHELLDVAATSPNDVWAVGFSAREPLPNLGATSGTSPGVMTVLEHWNGSSWQTVPSPNPGGSSGISVLSGVTAVSPTNASAVGYYSHRVCTCAAPRPLILHWNGTRWKRLKNQGHKAGAVMDVAALSSTRALAVWTGNPLFFTFHW